MIGSRTRPVLRAIAYLMMAIALIRGLLLIHLSALSLDEPHVLRWQGWTWLADGLFTTLSPLIWAALLLVLLSFDERLERRA